jgi:hypothetical protein
MSQSPWCPFDFSRLPLKVDLLAQEAGFNAMSHLLESAHQPQQGLQRDFACSLFGRLKYVPALIPSGASSPILPKPSRNALLVRSSTYLPSFVQMYSFVDVLPCKFIG